MLSTAMLRWNKPAIPKKKMQTFACSNNTSTNEETHKGNSAETDREQKSQSSFTRRYL